MNIPNTPTLVAFCLGFVIATALLAGRITVTTAMVLTLGAIVLITVWNYRLDAAE